MLPETQKCLVRGIVRNRFFFGMYCAIFQELQNERMHYENLNNAIFNALILELIVVNKKKTVAQFTLED